jgi:hypothetical protein
MKLRKVTATVYAIRSAYVEDRRNISAFAHCERATQNLSAQMKALIDLRTTLDSFFSPSCTLNLC